MVLLLTASKMDARELAKVAQACLCLHCLCRCGKCLIATWVALEGVRLLVASGIDCDHDGFISSNDMEDFLKGCLGAVICDLVAQVDEPNGACGSLPEVLLATQRQHPRRDHSAEARGP